MLGDLFTHPAVDELIDVDSEEEQEPPGNDEMDAAFVSFEQTIDECVVASLGDVLT